MCTKVKAGYRRTQATARGGAAEANFAALAAFGWASAYKEDKQSGARSVAKQQQATQQKEA